MGSESICLVCFLPESGVVKRLCSGLGSIQPCQRRHECANYVHWIDDPRSEFNICTITGRPSKHFVPRDIPVEAVQDRQRQACLF